MDGIHNLQPGDRVYRWVSEGENNGFDMAAQQELTVVRVNRKTVTVETRYGYTFRIDPNEIDGRWDDDEGGWNWVTINGSDNLFLAERARQ